MWKEPGKVIDWYAAWLWHNKDNVATLQYPAMAIEFADARSAQLLKELIEKLASLTRRYRSEATISARFKRDLRHILLPFAKRIDEEKDWSCLDRMYEASASLKVNEDGFIYVLASLAVTAIHTLVGSERRQLIGTRGGLAGWKDITSNYSLQDLLYFIPGHSMRYLDQSDASLYHQPSESTPTPLGEWPNIVMEWVTALFEDAYYNQRYIVHPQGVRVKLRYFDPIVGIKLKVKPGLTDRNYNDFVAIFEVDARGVPLNARDGENKQFFFALDGAFASGQAYAVTYNETFDVRTRYLAWVIAVIYHDLVTAETIHVAPHEKTATTSVWPNEAGLPEPSWVYIPRKVKEGYIEPRLKLPGARIMMPHHVSGHKRRGNMTEQHREEIEKFERRTGLKILDHLPDGYTFVRPHVSPSVEGLDELPRFIHARMQSDIERMMRQPLGGEQAPDESL